jgi:hypothetical protein
MYYIWHQMSQYISNLIFIASCFFIPSQYDLYWPLCNTALSGDTSECVFHNRNIFIHYVHANSLYQYCSFETWITLIVFHITYMYIHIIKNSGQIKIEECISVHNPLSSRLLSKDINSKIYWNFTLFFVLEGRGIYSPTLICMKYILNNNLKTNTLVSNMR